MIRCLTLQCQAGNKQKEESPITGALGVWKAHHCAIEFMVFRLAQAEAGEFGCSASLCTDGKKNATVMVTPSVDRRSADGHERPPLEGTFPLQFL